MNRDEERQRIGRRITELRKHAAFTDAVGIRRQSMTQQELADRAGVTRSNLNRIEQGRYNPGFDSLQQIAAAMGYRLDFVKDEP